MPVVDPDPAAPRRIFVWFQIEPDCATPESTPQVVGRPHMLVGSHTGFTCDILVAFASVRAVVTAYRNMPPDIFGAFAACSPRIVEADAQTAESWIDDADLALFKADGVVSMLGCAIRPEYAGLYETAAPLEPLVLTTAGA